MRTRLAALAVLGAGLLTVPPPAAAQEDAFIGFAHDGAGQKLVTLDPDTGETLVIDDVPSLRALAPAASVVDAGTGLLYQIGRATVTADSARLYVLEARNAEVVAEFPVETGYTNLHLRSDGMLLGLRWNGSEEELRSLDPATGASRLLATVPDLHQVQTGASVLDAQTDILYQVGRRADEVNLLRLFRLDGNDGSVLGFAQLDTRIHTLHLADDGTLSGLSWNGAQEELRSIDPVSGLTALVGAVPGVRFVAPAAGVPEPASGQLLRLGANDTPDAGPRLFRIDPTDGSLLDDLSLTALSNLHVVRADLAPRVLQSSACTWSVDHVKLTWDVLDLTDDYSHRVERALQASPTYTQMDPTEFERDVHRMTCRDYGTDPGVTYTYRVTVFDVIGTLAESEVAITTPHLTFALQANRPNPFPGETEIPYSIPTDATVRMRVHDLAGRCVRTLLDAPQEAGYHTARWDGRNDEGREVASGIYFVSLEAADEERNRKIVLVR